MPDTLTTPDELKVIYKSLGLARASGASTYVELGVRRAGTSQRVRAWLEKSKVRGRLLGVDIDERARGEWQRRLKKSSKDARLTWKFLLASSKEALDLIDGPIAWVFVDACHCVECATADIEGWGARLVPGGVLVVHDTTPRRRHYVKPFQHHVLDKATGKRVATRRFGVWEAVNASENGGWLSRHARKVIDHDDKNGVRVYVREDQNEARRQNGGSESADLGAAGSSEGDDADSGGGLGWTGGAGEGARVPGGADDGHPAFLGADREAAGDQEGVDA